MNEKEVELVVERLARRLEKLNTEVLKEIAKKIKQIKAINPSDSHKLAKIMQYGGDYDKIIKQLAKITKINTQELEKIFKEVAKRDYEFAEQFYKYREMKYIPWEENIVLQSQVKALAQQTANTYMNFANTRAIGFTIKDINGKTIFKSLDNTIQDTIDNAILNISRGETTFDNEMYLIMKKIGSSGLKYMDYASGYTRRLDSSVRMAIKDGLRQLHTENQMQFGREFGSDGVEITVHSFPAPDHAEVQGRQFSNEEFEKFQNDEDAVDYKGKVFPAIAEETGYDRRSIGQYNCYHTVYSIILGVNAPNYTDKELQDIIDNTNKEITFDNKKYNMYECTQLQRKLETEIRKQKDLQIMGLESGNQELIAKSQKNITQLTRKYKELSQESGLPTKLDRLRVENYKKVKITKSNDNRLFKEIYLGGKEYKYEDFIEFNPQRINDLEDIGSKYFNFESNQELDKYVTRISRISERIKNGDIELKKELDMLEPKIDKLAKKSPISFKLYSAKDITINYEDDEHLLSTTISKSIANLHVNKKSNKEVITIFVEKGANIISTYNTANRQFNRQGEILLPIKRKLERIDKYNYILRK